jgi:N-acetylglucosaminyl-diphospho-decaprenol L-rhamnosyltransferase
VADTWLDIVLVNFHSTKVLRESLAAADEAFGPSARFFLVDNSPGDGAADVARGACPDLTVVSNHRNRGFAAAVNRGVAAGSSDVVLLLNPDVSAIRGDVNTVRDGFQSDPRLGAVGVRLESPHGELLRTYLSAPRPLDLLSSELSLVTRFPEWRRLRQPKLLDWDYRSPKYVECFTGACLFLRREALMQVGPFDERFFLYWEETDWLVRAGAAGWRVLFQPAVCATHAGGDSSSGHAGRLPLLLIESQRIYARRHFGAVTALGLEATFCVADTLRLAWSFRMSSPRGRRRRAELRDRLRVRVTGHAAHPS